ncbi:uncharacterized protein PSFLO_01785 [Pseudozyma flocculosa]|uniref:Uncharacterized protein n=1 Tax=Pseudozyma flocculosa TaxID=84751 RepID=A0A5C3EVM7_9BASI|nr:uncharacterized protein PSFLO_01785 [Pseudozyma flocculosa]
MQAWPTSKGRTRGSSVHAFRPPPPPLPLPDPSRCSPCRCYTLRRHLDDTPSSPAAQQPSRTATAAAVTDLDTWIAAAGPTFVLFPDRVRPPTSSPLTYPLFA